MVRRLRTVEETLRMSMGKKNVEETLQASTESKSVETVRTSSGKKNWIRQELFSLAVVLAAVPAARSSLADPYYVPSGSMENSLIPGDRVFVDKTAYGFRIPLTKIDLFGARTPERGEIAVFDSPRDGTRLIKRIVAIGGDE